MTAQSGASYPRSRKRARAWVAAAEEGKAPSPCKAAQRRAAAAGALAWITGTVSHQEAQCAAKRSEEAERRPSPPNRWASRAVSRLQDGREASPCSSSVARHRATAASCSVAYSAVR